MTAPDETSPIAAAVGGALRAVVSALRDFRAKLPARLDRWVLDHHRPVDWGDMDDPDPWCAWCRRPWPCAEFLRLTAESE